MSMIHGGNRFAWSRLVVGLGVCAFIGFSLGCMNLSFGGRHEYVSSPKDGESVTDGLQRGKAYAGYAQELSVYYPIAYVSPPNLEFEDDAKSQLVIVDQKPDHFRVKNTHVGVEFTWKARGVLAPNAKASPVNSGTQANFGPPNTVVTK